MKKLLLCMMIVFLSPISQAFASDVGFSFGINFGYPGAVAPAYGPPPVVIEQPPQFIEPPGFGFYMAIDEPYDLFLLDNAYYLCIGNVWYTSPFYNGPWQVIYYDEMPYALRMYPFARIQRYRNYYYERYRDYGDWRGFHNFRPDRHETYRDRHDWRRPTYNNPGRTYNGAWGGHVYNAPTRPYQGQWNRPSNNTPYRNDHGALRSPAYNNSGRSDHGNGNRSANNFQNRGEQRRGTSPAYGNQERHYDGNWNRPADRSPNTYHRGYEVRQGNAGSSSHDNGSWHNHGHDR